MNDQITVFQSTCSIIYCIVTLKIQKSPDRFSVYALFSFSNQINNNRVASVEAYTFHIFPSVGVSLLPVAVSRKYESPFFLLLLPLLMLLYRRQMHLITYIGCNQMQHFF